jgi:hypothetical protein
MYRKDAFELEAAIGMYKSTNHRFRGITIFCRRDATISHNVAAASKRNAEREGPGSFRQSFRFDRSSLCRLVSLCAAIRASLRSGLGLPAWRPTAPSIFMLRQAVTGVEAGKIRRPRVKARMRPFGRRSLIRSG